MEEKLPEEVESAGLVNNISDIPLPPPESLPPHPILPIEFEQINPSKKRKRAKNVDKDLQICSLRRYKRFCQENNQVPNYKELQELLISAQQEWMIMRGESSNNSETTSLIVAEDEEINDLHQIMMNETSSTHNLKSLLTPKAFMKLFRNRRMEITRSGESRIALGAEKAHDNYSSVGIGNGSGHGCGGPDKNSATFSSGNSSTDAKGHEDSYLERFVPTTSPHTQPVALSSLNCDERGNSINEKKIGDNSEEDIGAKLEKRTRFNVSVPLSRQLLLKKKEEIHRLVEEIDSLKTHLERNVKPNSANKVLQHEQFVKVPLSFLNSLMEVSASSLEVQREIANVLQAIESQSKVNYFNT